MMTSRTGCALVAALAAAVIAPVGLAKPPTKAGLRAYVASIAPEIQAYRKLHKRADRLFSEPPQANVDPWVYAVIALADRVDDLGWRWGQMKAPGLRIRHRDMANAFALEARAFRVVALGFFTRHPEEIEAAQERAKPLLHRAAALQKRWAAALWGALVRAGIRIPAWLDGMAHGP
jgi:hypothetical protein